MIAAAVFDMDGLLIDSELYWQQAHVEAVKKYGHDLKQDVVRQKAGHRTVDVAQDWINLFGINESASELTQEIEEQVIITIERDGKALPGVYAALEMFATHDIPMAIASSASDNVISAVVSKLGLDKYILFAYSATHEAKGKPDPAVFLTAAKKLGVVPADCVVFEDALSGIRAAKSAGMKCIAVPELANQHKSEFKDSSDIILSSLNDLDWDMVKSLFAYS